MCLRFANARSCVRVIIIGNGWHIFIYCIIPITCVTYSHVNYRCIDARAKRTRALLPGVAAGVVCCVVVIVQSAALVCRHLSLTK